MKCLTLIIATFTIQMIFANSGHCQEIYPAILTISYDKAILCRGEAATLTIQRYTTTGGNGWGYITTEDLKQVRQNCHFTGECLIAADVEPSVEGKGVISKEVVIRKGCNNDPTVQSLVVIKVKPKVTTTYTITWEVKSINGADESCAKPEEITRITKFRGTVKIEVVQPDPPSLYPRILELNQSPYASEYITATSEFISNARGMRWYETICDSQQLKETDRFYNGNTMNYTIIPKNLGTMEIRAQKLDRLDQGLDKGCFSNLSEPAIVKVKPCKLFSSGCNQTDVDIVEGLSCDPMVAVRSDYHFYDNANTVCEGNNCDIENVWRSYKEKLSNQIPIQTDQFSFLGRILGNSGNLFLSKALFPEGNFNSPITDNCNQIVLPRPYSFAINLGTYSPDGRVALISNAIKALGAGSYFDPVFLRVDESSKCVVNYTSSEHIFFPGKVTRCIVKECNKVKILTFGEGTTKFGDNLLGETFARLNEFAGIGMFANVDQRFISDYNSQKQNLFTKKEIETPLNNSIQLINKIWSIGKFQILYNNSDTLTSVFYSGDTTNFWNLKLITLQFNSDGSYDAVDVLGGHQNGTWSLDTISSQLRLDTSNYTISFSGNDFLIKGNTIVSKDTSFTIVDYYLTMISNATCFAPLDLSTTEITTSSSKANWINFSENTGFRFQYKQKGETKWKTVKLDKTQTSYIMKGLSSNTQYFWRIATVCQEKPTRLSLYSPIQKFKTSSSLIAKLTKREVLSQQNIEFK